jgi:hypothetical protein
VIDFEDEVPMLVLLVAIFIVLIFCLPAHTSENYGVLVFGPEEIRSIAAGKNTRLEFPMVNGQPDWKHGTLIAPLVDVDRKGGHYEVRHK